MLPAQLELLLGEAEGMQGRAVPTITALPRTPTDLAAAALTELGVSPGQGSDPCLCIHSGMPQLLGHHTLSYCTHPGLKITRGYFLCPATPVFVVYP